MQARTRNVEDGANPLPLYELQNKIQLDVGTGHEAALVAHTQVDSRPCPPAEKIGSHRQAGIALYGDV